MLRFLTPFFVFLLLAATQLQAQSNSNYKSYTIDDVLGTKASYSQRGNLNLIVEPGINSLLDKYNEQHRVDPKISGYRVQLYFGTREKATDAKTEFLKKFPRIKSYISYLNPNFRVRVGNFRNQLSAEAFLVKIKSDFPAAYIVADKIELPEL